MQNIRDRVKWLLADIDRGGLVVAGLIVVLGVVVYSNTLTASWHFDDYERIVNNPQIHSWRAFRHRLSWNWTRMVGDATFVMNWMTDEDRVMGYHLVNIGIHIIASLVVWRLVGLLSYLALNRQNGWRPSQIRKGIRGERRARVMANWMGLVAGLVFVAHPVQTQAVTYIVQRYESLSGLFYVIAMYGYVRGRVERIRRKKTLWWLVVVVSGGLGLLTKETLLSLPMMILLIELLVLSEKWRRLMARVMMMVGLMMAGFGLVVTEMGWNYLLVEKTSSLGRQITWIGYFLTQFRVLLKYLQLLWVPVRQNLDYYFPMSVGVDAGVGVGMVVLVGMVGLMWYWRKKRVVGALGVGWLLVSLMVTWLMPLQDMIFDHRLYLGVVGFGMVVGSLVVERWYKARGWMLVVIVMMGMILGGMSWSRNRVWQSEYDLWRDAAMKSPKKVRALNQYAVWRQQKGEIYEAMELYERSLEIEPDNADVYYNLGQAYLSLGELDRAIEAYGRSVELNPKIARAYCYMGLAEARRENYDEALEYLERCLKGEPKFERGREWKEEVERLRGDGGKGN